MNRQADHVISILPPPTLHTAPGGYDKYTEININNPPQLQGF